MDVFHVHLGKILADFQGTADIKWNTEPPTKPSFYWFQRELTSRALMVGIRATDGQLTVWWPNQDVPVTNLKGVWRGPILPSSGPGSR